jgi:predicted dehydrogenase
MVLAITGLLLALIAAPPANVKGKWDGTITGQRPDGTTSEDSALMILDQKDGTITGTVGSDESDRHPITSGTIDGNKVTLLAKHATNGREYKIELTVEGDQMKGTLMAGERRGQLVLKRRKE